jgi:hypothetical protein
MSPVSIFWSKAKGLVVIPAKARTEAGFWMDIEPVAVVPLGERAAVRSVIRLAAFRPVDVIPTPARDKFPKPVVLKPGKVRSWSQFHWNYSCAFINQEKDGPLRFEVWEKCADGSYQPDSQTPVRYFSMLDEAVEAAIVEIQKPE